MEEEDCPYLVLEEAVAAAVMLLLSVVAEEWLVLVG